jgi:hypothetical protein
MEQRGAISAEFSTVFQPDTLDEDIDSLVDHVIDPWIADCCDGHPSCKAVDESSSVLPTRVIDVSEEPTLFLRHAPSLSRDTAGIPPPYLILSYCWGGIHQGITTWGNVEDRITEGFSSDELPQTMQDAIKLTRQMGLKYLWIDALCIVQPAKDPNNPGMASAVDWQREAPRMKDYYRNARCTIAASRARRGDYGFLDERLCWRFGFPRACVVGTRAQLLGGGDEGAASKPSVDENGKVQEEHLLWYAEPCNWVEEFVKQPLMIRGWCFQEWLLSRRVLHFSRTGLYWECRTQQGLSEAEVNTSDLDKAVHPGIISNVGNASQEAEQLQDVRRGLGTSIAEADIPLLWTEVLRIYCKMNLSYLSDRLVAIHGVAESLLEHGKYKLQKMGCGEGAKSASEATSAYAAGVFRHGLAGLLWQGAVSRPALGDLGKELPSWSWACLPTGNSIVFGALQTRPTVGLNYRHTLAEAVSLPGEGVSDYSTLDKRKLVLNALVRTVDFGAWTIGQRFHDQLCPGKTVPAGSKVVVDEEEDRLRAETEASNMGRDTSFSLHFDAEYLIPRPTVGKLTLLFLGYSLEGEQKYPQFNRGVKVTLVGLVLRPIVAAGSGNVPYMRVGSVSVKIMEDVYQPWLKAEAREEIALV